MQKVTVITGGRMESRFTKAEEIIGSRKSEIIYDYISEMQIKDLIGKVDVLVFVSVSLHNHKPITALINTNNCLVRKAYAAESVNVPRPEMIVLVNDRALFDGQVFGTGPFIEYLNY